MGRKTNDTLIDERLKRALKVSELIRKLKEMPQDAVVGSVGHFGELNECDKYAVSLRLCYVTPEGWRNDYRRENISIVEIHMPDIGPDPD